MSIRGVIMTRRGYAPLRSSTLPPSFPFFVQLSKLAPYLPLRKNPGYASGGNPGH